MEEIRKAFQKLNSLLPLKERQDQLSKRQKTLHQWILRFIVENGGIPNIGLLTQRFGDNVVEDIHILAENDLIVINSDSLPIGAYPVTLETTPHSISMDKTNIYAMCALDALSIAPMFNKSVHIHSQCHLTHMPIDIDMQGEKILNVNQPALMIGIRWQKPYKVAAHSLCLQMVFLENTTIATQWQSSDPENISLFTLPESILFGKAYFLPLLN